MINQKNSNKLFNRTIVSSLFATLLTFASYTNAEALNAHGTVKFVGEIVDSACSIDPEAMDQTVELGQISNQLLEKGGESPIRPFQIHLQGCSIETAKSVSVTFSGNTADADKKQLAIEGTAKGAAISLNNQHTGQEIVMGTPQKIVDLLEGDNTLEFGAKVVKVASEDVKSGQFSATTNFVISYQ